MLNIFKKLFKITTAKKEPEPEPNRALFNKVKLATEHNCKYLLIGSVYGELVKPYCKLKNLMSYGDLMGNPNNMKLLDDMLYLLDYEIVSLSGNGSTYVKVNIRPKTKPTT